MNAPEWTKVFPYQPPNPPKVPISPIVQEMARRLLK